MGSVVGTLFHHTAGSLTSQAPSRNIIVNGRPGVPGPLANVYITRDRDWNTVRDDPGVGDVWVNIVADGKANHAGEGSGTVVGELAAGRPPSKTAGERGLADTTVANAALWGIEVENNGVGEPWDPDVLQATGAVCQVLGLPVTGHKHYTRRKIDPYGLDAAAIAAVVAGDYTTDDEEQPMRAGDKGPKVRHWQRRMIALGYARRPDGSTVTDWKDKWADADYGPATTAATKRFQDTDGYRPTGEVDADLRDRMVEAFTAQRAAEDRQALAARLTRRFGDETGMSEAKIRQLIATESDEAAREAVSAALADEYAVTIQRRDTA